MPEAKIKSADGLAARGLIDPADVDSYQALGRSFAIGVSAPMLDLIESPTDPIGLQFVPDLKEQQIQPWEQADPIGDKEHSPVKGLVHRYPDRVLLKIAVACPVYCRFCFRKEMIGPGSDELMSSYDIHAAMDYIKADKNIWEVILTGGDPLALSPRRIREITESLNDIDHVSVVRWHTRVPVVEPALVTDDLVTALTATVKTVYVAVHTNHAKEHTLEAEQACRKLQSACVSLIGQTVLLKDVNDNPDALTDLLRSCVRLGIKPYYLHLLDRAKGTSHFRVPLSDAIRLLGSLRGNISGLCQPNLMLDVPGGHGKVVVSASAVHKVAEGAYRVRDFNGREHIYNDFGSTDGLAGSSESFGG